MNCKPGDLAVVVGHEGAYDAGCLGRIVEVISPGDDWSSHGDSRHHWRAKDAGGRPMPWQDPDGTHGESLVTQFPDEHLRPIRDQPGADETLTWAGLPAPTNTPTPEVA